MKLFGFLILFYTALWANDLSESQENSAYTVQTSAVHTNHESDKIESISLDSFGSTGMILMLVFSSLLGAFFVRDELDILIH